MISSSISIKESKQVLYNVDDKFIKVKQKQHPFSFYRGMKLKKKSILTFEDVSEMFDISVSA